MNDKKHDAICKIKEMVAELNRNPMAHEFKNKHPDIDLDKLFGYYDNALAAAGRLEIESHPPLEPREPKILVLDIETKPLVVYCFGLFDQNIGLDQIIEDWSVLSWAAKWIGKEEIYYQDLSSNTDYTKDEQIIYGIWELMNEADVIVGQNSIKFDAKKLNEKFELYNLGPPSYYQHIDTLRIKKKNFSLTSNKLEYSAKRFNKENTKLKHAKFPGFMLHKECLQGNQEAWEEMKKYNIADVLSTEELYLRLRKYDKTINYGTYTHEPNVCPACGSHEIHKSTHHYTKTGAFMSYKCKSCGAFSKSGENLLLKSVKKGLLK